MADSNTPTTFKITTPHAAIKIWNYVDRMTAEGADTALSDSNMVKEEIISTVSCSTIQTVKEKNSPMGSFNFVLAPTRNWTAVITPGSWCAIMMSNEPIEKADFTKANPKLLKMVGKITTARTSVTVNSEGARATQFLVSGEDWGYVFHNILYVDPLIADQNDKHYDQGNTIFKVLIPILERKGTALVTKIKDNLETLLEVFGRPISAQGKTARLGKNTSNLLFPSKLAEFLGLPVNAVLPNVDLVSGALQNSEGQYTDVDDGMGYIESFSLVGSHNLWQVLQDNANYVLNEMFADMVWDANGQVQFTLFNRIKPFAYRDQPVDQKSAALRSLFKYVPSHKIDSVQIKSVNAGTNWSDKYNFLEIKPEGSDWALFENLVKQKNQAWDDKSTAVFDREGFRPMILTAKQLPYTNPNTFMANPSALESWAKLLQEWYFETHRMLNGEIAMTGSTEYITVGNNIMFDAEVLGVKHNMNAGHAAADQTKHHFVLGQIETVRNVFQVDEEGARSFQTVITFVRGIIVDENKTLVGDGTLDALSTDMAKDDTVNDRTIVATTPDDPTA